MKKNSLISQSRKYTILLLDVFIIAVNFMLALLSCHRNFLNVYSSLQLVASYMAPVCLFVAVFFMFNVYNIIWRYINIDMLFDICIFSVISLSVGCLFMRVVLDMSISSEFAGFFICGSTLCVIFSRMCYYYIYSKNNAVKNVEKKKRLLIIGGGEAALFLLKELRQNNKEGYDPIGILDDDPGKFGRLVWNVKVIGDTSMIERCVNEYDIDSIIFSIINISAERKKDILARCTDLCGDVVVIESIIDSFSSGERIELKKITMEDLLGRDSIDFVNNRDYEYLTNKVVLVTGGGGSIGSELCMQINKFNPKAIVIVDIYENNAYDVQQRLIEKCSPGVGVYIEIASVRDKKKIERIFKQYSPEVVFHAAAHKHVPLMETNPEEAIKNNVAGTLNVLELCNKYTVKRFILISTDKAVNPTNVMGATKRICEKMMIAFSRDSKTIFSAVRFGNVLGSNGSVVPLFEHQVKMGGPVTVTHPDVTRFFMTIPEAVSLVISAGAIAKGGEIFVLDMGKQVKIKDLAENIIRLSGKVPYKDIDIKYIGLRPGEKMYEELLINMDELKRTLNDKIFVEDAQRENKEALLGEVKDLVAASQVDTKEELKKQIQAIVPEYTYE